jgi:hypothetical protein
VRGEASARLTGVPTSQKPSTLASIAARVSPAPRSTPDATTCVPSNTWNTPAIGMSVEATAITPGTEV